jgi:iron complex transport system ATP-binding protein
MIAGGTPPALSLEGLTVRYGDRVALHSVDLTVPRGEFLALTGPNGSGKSTLMRAVLGFLPVEGSVELFGTRATSLSVRERARRVAWVPQEEPLRDNVRLEEYVLYGRYSLHGPLDGTPPEERRLVHELLEQVALGDRARDGVLTLSGGERQRAILARALAQKAPLLMLDEPTAHLDIAHQLDILGRVRALARSEGVTVVAALHDLNLAARFADRIAVLAHGRRVADGTPTEVLSEELLARVWGVAADLEQDRRTGLPYLVPHQIAARASRTGGSPFRGPVHVVGGGGAGAPYLRLLAEEGFRVTAGALHLLDTDAEVAEGLGIPSAIEGPFAPLGPEARAHHAELLAAARAIVVAPFAVGPSNLSNLEDVRPFVPTVPTFLVRLPPIRDRDFSGGRAEAAYRALLDAGATEVTGPTELLEGLRARLAASEASASSVTGRTAA